VGEDATPRRAGGGEDQARRGRALKGKEKKIADVCLFSTAATFSSSSSSSPRSDLLLTFSLFLLLTRYENQNKTGQGKCRQARDVSHDVSRPAGRREKRRRGSEGKRLGRGFSRAFDACQIILRSLPGDETDLFGPEGGRSW